MSVLPGIGSIVVGEVRTTVLTLSVAVGGFTTWDLDSQGPLTITSTYTGTLTPSGGVIDVDLVLRGSGGGGSTPSSPGGHGQATTFNDGYRVLDAGGGSRGGSGGANGQAFGGDANVTGGGAAGGDRGFDYVSPDNVYGNDGGNGGRVEKRMTWRKAAAVVVRPGGAGGSHSGGGSNGGGGGAGSIVIALAT